MKFEKPRTGPEAPLAEAPPSRLESRVQSARLLAALSSPAASPGLLEQALREHLPDWALGARVHRQDDRIVVTLPDICSASGAKIRALEEYLGGLAPVTLRIARSPEYTRIMELIREQSGLTEVRGKLDLRTRTLHVIIDTEVTFDASLLRGQIQAATGYRTHLVIADPESRPIVFNAPGEERSTQDSALLKQARLLARQIVPPSWRAEVSTGGEEIRVTYFGSLRSVAEENRLAREIEERTGIPTRVLRPRQQGSLKEALYTSLPQGMDIWKASFYRIALGTAEQHCAMVKMHVPPGRDAEALAWRLALEERFGVRIIAQHEHVSMALTRQLQGIADRDGLVRDTRRLNGLIDSLNGRAPEPELNVPAFGAHLRDLRATVPLLTFDTPGTRDPEDALFAERQLDGTFRLRVAFADAARFAPPGSRLARHARRNSVTTYFGDKSMTMLGDEVTFNRVALLPNEDRMAWVVDLHLSKEGRMSRYEFYPALVRVRAAFEHRGSDSPDEVPSEYRDIVRALQQVGSLLERRRRYQRAILRLEPELESDRMVAACMIAARERIAHFFSSRRIPLPYRVHGPPGSELRRHFLESIRAIGVPVSRRDFNSPKRFDKLLGRLQESHAGQGILFDLLDSYLERSRFSALRSPHVGVRAAQYTEIKGGRSYAGLLTQTQALAHFSGEKPLSMEQMEREVRRLNRKARTAWQHTARIAMMKQIAGILAESDIPLEATVERETGQGVILFCETARISGRLVSGESTPELGSRLTVRIAGFDPKTMRYVFEPAGAAGAAVAQGRN